jgi:uric acid transporter
MAQADVAAQAPRARAKHPVDEILPPHKLAVYGFQHVLAFYAGAVVVPLLLAGAIGLNERQLAFLINADLFTCGIASIIQSIGFWNIGVRLPLLQGVTFTAVAPMIAIGNAKGGGVPGLREIYGAVIVAGIFTFLIAPIFSRLIRFFPPIVTGTVIASIGLVLLPVAALEAGGGNAQAPDFGSLTNLAMAFGTLVFILLIYRFFRGFLSTIAVLLGLVVGTAVAALFGQAHFEGVGDAAWFGLITPLRFGLPTFGLAAIISMIVVMLITAVETTGDVFATGEIVEKPIGPRDIARALRADGLATTLGGIFNSFPYTCFAENVGLVRLTRVKSRYVVGAAGLIMIVIGLIPKTGAIVAAIPHAVLGGAAIVLFGTVAVVGIQVLRRVDFHDERNVVILATSLGLALIPVAFPTFYQNLPDDWQVIVASGITMGSLSAIILNIVFNVLGGRRNLVHQVEPTPFMPERVTIDQVNDMPREQFVSTFGPLFQGTTWVVEQAYESRPFEDVYDLRHAFHRALFEAPPERQLELIRAYPHLASVSTGDATLGPESIRDQSSAGLDRLTPEESEAFQRLTGGYREKFGFPLIVAVRENTKETILAAGEARLRNTPAQEQATALVEVAKIANLRLFDLVEEPVEDRVPAQPGVRSR